MIENKEWKKIRLGDIITLNYGKSLPAKKRVKGNIPVYSSAGNTGNHNIALVEEKGIIVGRKGTVGSVYRVDVPFCCIDTAFFITQKDSRVNLDYLYYLLKWLPLDKLNSDSAIPGLNRENAYNQEFKISLVKKEQEKIADILKSLDDKIELNNKMNETLEEMAQTIFKEWFVNFNFPNEEGKPYKDNGGKMVESALGMIPEGWRVEKLGNKINVTDYVANGSFKALKENVSLYDFPNEVLYVRTTDYNNNFKGNLKYTDKASYDFLKKSKLTGDEIIISNVGDVGTVFRAPVWLGLPMTLGSNAVSLYLENYNSYIYYYFKSRVGQHQVEAITTGSAQLKFNKTNLRSLEILIPNEVMLKKFGKIENKFYEKFKEIKKEIVILTKIRDNLLPKLMSGKVRV